jgi:nitrogen fixation protein NifB
MMELSKDLAKHPCFDAEARHTSGRIHLAVAPRCNIQCNFCDRKYDCANESRPGVTTSVLKPAQALDYLAEIDRKVPNLAVVGIAGPGDPFANPAETLETLERVRDAFPDKLLCISSNGLNISDYIPRLAELKVSHVTVTVNAVEPGIGAGIYEWVYFKGKSYFGREGAEILLSRQTEAIKLLKQYGLTVKINTVVVPRVNQFHVHEISRYVAALGADIQNCIPLIPVAGTLFAALNEPSASDMRSVRAKTSVHIAQMTHCARCRADAVGLLGKDVGPGASSETHLQVTHKALSFDKRPNIAVATLDGVSINQHLGRAYNLWIYGQNNGNVELLEKRSILDLQRSQDRWNSIADAIPDCAALLVSALGNAPLQALKNKGLYVEAVNGPVQEVVSDLFRSGSISGQNLRLTGFCSEGAGGCAVNSN